ncbi:MAG: CBS domain-containing protein [Candidatus Bathyarchaeota archaeon]|nr:CBS domain-containing protein [Candidatus Bathyarchaeota archaeon]
MKTGKNLDKEFPSVMDSAYKQYKHNLSRYKQANEIMTRTVFTINPEASMYEAAKIMGEKHIGSLIVTKYDTPVGIVTERDLLTKVLALEKNLKTEKIEKVMSYPLVSIGLTTKIKEAAKTMINQKGRLAVFDAGKLVGIVTASDLIRSLPEIHETEAKVDDFMTKKVITTDEKTSINTVAKIMGKKRIGSVIITKKGKPIGIFTERDLLTTILSKDKPLTTQVGKKASSPLITQSSGISIHKAAITMTIKHIRRLPIVKREQIIGIITARDLVEAYAK